MTVENDHMKQRAVDTILRHTIDVDTTMPTSRQDGAFLSDVPLHAGDGSHTDQNNQANQAGSAKTESRLSNRSLNQTSNRSIKRHPSSRSVTREAPADDDVSIGSMVSSLAMIASASVHETLVYTVAHSRVVFIGQIISFTMAARGAAQATLQFECSLSAPAFSSFLFYCILALGLVPLHGKGKRIRATDSRNVNESNVTPVVGERFVANYWFLWRTIPLEVSPLSYLAVAFFDVQGTYLTVLAFRYTALTSVTLLDALSIPTAVILSRIFLRRRHTTIHFVAIFLCVSGVFYNAMVDYESDQWTDDSERNDGGNEYPHKLVGDIMAILGGIIYGANDVLAEALLRQTGGATEFLGMLGFLGAAIAFVQALILEGDNIRDFFQTIEDPEGKVCTAESTSLILVWFVVANVLNYILTARFLLISEATFLNLSLLTADIWSVLFTVIAEEIVPQPLFFVALTMIVSGVLIYELAPSPVVDGLIVDEQRNLNNSFGSDGIASNQEGLPSGDNSRRKSNNEGILLTREASNRSQRDDSV